MASTTFEDRPYADRADAAPRERSVGEHIFIWMGWALAAAFWGATFTTLFGIVESVSRPTPGGPAGADFAGVAWLLMAGIGGIVVLGAALAYGSYQYATRNRRLDPVAEAATARLYDQIERQGGEDMTSRSPDSERARREFR